MISLIAILLTFQSSTQFLRSDCDWSAVEPRIDEILAALVPWVLGESDLPIHGKIHGDITRCSGGQGTMWWEHGDVPEPLTLSKLPEDGPIPIEVLGLSSTTISSDFPHLLPIGLVYASGGALLLHELYWIRAESRAQAHHPPGPQPNVEALQLAAESRQGESLVIRMGGLLNQYVLITLGYAGQKADVVLILDQPELQFVLPE